MTSCHSISLEKLGSERQAGMGISLKTGLATMGKGYFLHKRSGKLLVDIAKIAYSKKKGQG